MIMKKLFYPLLAIGLLGSSAFMSVTSAPEWKIKDDHSIKFISDDPTGVFKTYKVPFSCKKADNSGKFTGKFNVKRSDFKIGKAGGNVPDVMKIEFSVPVDKK